MNQNQDIPQVLLAALEEADIQAHASLEEAQYEKGPWDKGPFSY